MLNSVYAVSAPGSIMLSGEHAVLGGGPALCGAVDQRIRVILQPRHDDEIHLFSALGEYHATVTSYQIEAPFEFVLTAINRYVENMPSGFDLRIQAEFASTMGLGSSSAVTVAAIYAITQWLQMSLSLTDLFYAAKAVVLEVQGCGSGADVAATVWGGIVDYRMQPFTVQTIAAMPEIVLVYSGAKVPTKTVIRYVLDKQQAEPQRYQHLFDAINVCTCKSASALHQHDWQQLGTLMNEHYSLQQGLEVSTPVLHELIMDLREYPSIYGAKISGSGLGDCVIGLGTLPELAFPRNTMQKNAGVQQIPIKISSQGVRLETSP